MGRAVGAEGTRVGRCEEVWPFVALRPEERSAGFPTRVVPSQGTGETQNGLAFGRMRAKGPESYQPGPTAQVTRLSHFRRAEGPSHRSGIGWSKSTAHEVCPFVASVVFAEGIRDSSVGDPFVLASSGWGW